MSSTAVLGSVQMTIAGGRIPSAPTDKVGAFLVIAQQAQSDRQPTPSTTHALDWQDEMGPGNISTVIEHRLSAIFGGIGWHLAAHPFRFMLALIVLAAILSAGIPSIKGESEAEKLYTPSSNNRGTDDLNKYKDMFSAVDNEQAGNFFIAYVDSKQADKNDANLFTPAVLNDLLILHQKIKALKVTEGDRVRDLSDWCTLSAQNGTEQECAFQGVSDLMTGPIQAVSELSLGLELTQDRQGAYQVTPLFAGGRSLSAEGKTVTKVQAFRWSIILEDGRLAEEDMVLRDDWMRLMLDTLFEESEKLEEGSPYKLAFQVDFSQGEELAKSTNGDITLLMITVILVIVFSFLIVRSYSDTVLSKGNVVWGAVLGILLALGSTFGLMGWCGVVFNPVVSTSALLLLGLGMDDAFVIIQAWHSSAADLGPEATVQERMQKVYETAGVSIFFTSLTDIIAFTVGCTSSFPAVRGFCAYTATGIFFDFVFQLLFFGAVMAIDGHREYCGASQWQAYLGYGWLHQDWYSPNKDLTARVALGNAIPVMPEVTAIKKAVGKYGRVLFQPWCSASVLAVFAGYLVYAVVGVVSVGTGLDIRDLAASDSYWTVFVNQDFKNFNEKGPLYNVAFPAGSIDWSVKSDRDQVLELLESLEALDCLVEEKRGVWLRELYSIGGAAARDAEGAAFYTELKAWLDSPGLEFKKDVLLADSAVASGPAVAVSAARMEVRMMPFQTTSGDGLGVPCMQDSRKVLDAWQEGRAVTGMPPLISADPFQFWEASAVIVEQTTLNLIYAAAGCFLVTLVILPHPVMCCLTMLTVAMILAGVVGTMSLILDIRIETISMINLVLSIGFSIDNVAHYCHAYMASKMTTRKDKAQDALERIGMPILAGDASTMIALLPLLGSKSLIFRSFFLILFTVLLLGALHAVIFLPVVLAWIGPLPDQQDVHDKQSREMTRREISPTTSGASGVQKPDPPRGSGFGMDHSAPARVGSYSKAPLPSMDAPPLPSPLVVSHPPPEHSAPSEIAPIVVVSQE